MKPFLHKPFVVFGAFAIMLAFLAGCNDKITYVPVIDSVVVVPDTVVVGGSAIIQMEVTDADDENLVIYYTTNGGAISGVGDTVTWLAPNVAGVYTTNILVTDKDGNQAVDSVNLVVVKNDTALQISGNAVFPSPSDLDLAESKVRIYTSKENWANHNAFAIVKTAGFGSIVSFTFNYVPSGTYYLDVWKDIDFGNTINVGDYFGWYGNGTIYNPNPEPFNIEPGVPKVLNIQMRVVPAK
ncbi:MAG: hypothetical protein ACOYN4_11920 [Bacteroidales bacterium]